MAVRSAEPSPSRCSCPTNSSIVRGRMRTASGCSAAGTVVRRGGRSRSSKSVPTASKSRSADYALGHTGGMPDPDQLERSATELLQQLIRFDTVNPPGNEQAIQDFVQEKLEAAG